MDGDVDGDSDCDGDGDSDVYADGDVAVAMAVERRQGGLGLAIGALALQVTTLWVRSLDSTDLQHLIIAPIGLLFLHLALARRGAYRELADMEPNTPTERHVAARES